MVRGTNPTLTLTCGDNTLELPAASSVYVTIERNDVTVTKTGSALSVSGNVVSLYLDEDESLALLSGPAEIQVNWLPSSGRRMATRVATINIGKQLLLEELTT